MRSALATVNPWVVLAFTIVTEVFGSTCLKLSDGMTKLPWSALVAAAYLVTFYAFSVALRQLPLGLAYAIWAGVGTIGTFLVGCLVFGETGSLLRWGGVVLITGGIALLNLG